MSAIDDGGPAFPQNDLGGYGMGPAEGNNAGMSLRDYFAGQCISGLVRRAGLPRRCAEMAYAMADAMLAARAAKKEDAA